MTSKSEIAALTVTSLRDVRSAGTALAIEDLILRPEHGPDVPASRIFRKVDGTPIATMDELLAEITEPNISLAYSLTGYSAEYKDKCKPIQVVLNSVEIRLMDDVLDDSYYTSIFGAKCNTLVITMMYLGDADGGLPIKAIDMSILTQQKKG